MRMYRNIPIFWLCLVVLGTIPGCARPRTGPHDVPAAAVRGGGAQQSEDVLRAAAEINAVVIFFDFDKYVLKPESERALSRVAEILRNHPSIRISIRGHCDSRGSEEYNYGLGARRARAAFHFLVRCGVNPAQLDMVTHGENSPAVKEISEETKALNRRNEFIVLTTCF